MGSMTVRNLPDEIHNQLKQQAALNKRSVEAEVRSILTEAVVSASGGGIGQRLRDRFKSVRGEELSVERDTTASDSGIFQ